MNFSYFFHLYKNIFCICCYVKQCLRYVTLTKKENVLGGRHDINNQKEAHLPTLWFMESVWRNNQRFNLTLVEFHWIMLVPQDSYVIPIPYCVLCPAMYLPLAFAQWKLLYHHPARYMYLFSVLKITMSLSLSFLKTSSWWLLYLLILFTR